MAGTSPSPFAGLARVDLREGPSEVWRARCRRSAGLSGAADEAARKIIEAVAKRGDEAVSDFTQEFEGRTLAPADFEVGPQLREQAQARVPEDVRVALSRAADRVRVFHETQVPASTGIEGSDEKLRSRVTPLGRVAVYAPGGTAAYPSSVLMAGIPAKVAGVAEIILFTPRASDVVLLAAKLAGIDRVFQIGGAQAIAAAAMGTQHVPRVDKIVGPGNAYVTAAKRRVFGLCDIDSIAGPSEILIIADEDANPEVVAADLLSQAEHDVLACAVLVTPSDALAHAVDAALVRQLADLPRRDIAIEALRGQGATVVVADIAQAVAATNEYAPEHLELLAREPAALTDSLTTAGAIFVGAFTPEAAGDYTAGPSHVLPTAGAARFSSPLGVWDFVKYTSILELSETSLRSQAAAITTLARAEGLEAHARAVEIRLGSRKPT